MIVAPLKTFCQVLKMSLTDEQVRQLLRNCYGNAENQHQVTEVIEKPFSEISGFLGEHFNLTLKLRGPKNEPETLQCFLKKLPVKNTAFLNYVLESNAFAKEVFVYTKFLDHARRFIPNLRVPMPEMYFGNANVVVLQDLSSIGYRMLSKTTDIESKHILLALKSLAEFHAVSYVIEETESKLRGRSYRLVEDYRGDFKEGMFVKDPKLAGTQLNNCSFEALWYISSLLLPKSGSGAQEQFLAKLSEEYANMLDLFLKDNGKYRSVCCHGDLWLNNLVFKHSRDDSASDCLLIDFQLVRYAPPAHDVTFLLYQLASGKLMRENYRNYLSHYYECLRDELLLKHGLDAEQVLPLDEYEETCKIYLPVAQIVKAFYSTLNAASQETCRRILADSAYFHEFLFVDRKAACKEILQGEREYRETFEELVANIQDSLFNKTLNQYDVHHVLNQLLGDSDGYEIDHYELERFPEQLFDFLTVWVRTQNNEAVEKMRFSVKTRNVTRNELIFYTQLSEQAKDVVQTSYLLKLNDLNVLQSVDNYQRSSSHHWQLEQFVVVLKALAKLHFSSLTEAQKPESAFNHQLPPFFKDSEVKTVLTSLKLHFEDYPRKEQLIRYLERLFRPENLLEWSKSSPKYTNVVSHGNLNIHNIFFHTRHEAKVLLTNFDSCSYVPPTRDFLDLVYATTSAEFRVENNVENVLLALYSEELQKLAESSRSRRAFALKELIASCRDDAEGALIRNLIFAARIGQEELGQACDEFKERFERIC